MSFGHDIKHIWIKQFGWYCSVDQNVTLRIPHTGNTTFIAQAYTLEPHRSFGGKQVLNFLLGEIENRRGEVVVAFAGDAKEMQTLFELNEGLPSRFPKTWRFEDYSDEVLLDIFKSLMEEQGRGELHLASSTKDKDKWARVAIARLGRKRGTRCFGNAHAVSALFNKAMQRQSDRLSRVDDDDDDDDLDPYGSHKSDLDPYELQKSDLLGTSFADLEESEDWKILRDMIGLSSVKEAVRKLGEMIKTNHVLELAGKPLREVALNRCMLGNPGTGKFELWAGVGQSFLTPGYCFGT